MRIHRVRIDNFRCLRDFEVSFCDASGEPRPLTVLVGPNMSGKTTVRRHGPPAPLVDDLRVFFERIDTTRAAA